MSTKFKDSIVLLITIFGCTLVCGRFPKFVIHRLLGTSENSVPVGPPRTAVASDRRASGGASSMPLLPGDVSDADGKTTDVYMHR